ncbi:MAG TPA: response regulator [Usitatibacter sp.]|nr:response regulator [Usitatibacter sp.]
MGAISNSVVVVEDDPSMSQAMARMLRVSGMIPVMFSSAEELLEGDELGIAACLIIDVQLPGLNGFALRDRLAAAGKLPPVIFITAFDDADTRALAERAGMFAFLRKPFSGQALMEAVRRAAEAAA